MTTGSSGNESRDIERQISDLIEIVGTLASKVSQLGARVSRVERRPKESNQDPQEESKYAPGPWVWFSPPAGPDDQSDAGDDVTVVHFVAWYNITYCGLDGSRSKPIPPCWERHPGLAMEVASLAYSWRAANLGPDASAREAQSWHHHWRPGFADRLTRDWVHTDCLDGDHRSGSVDERPSRFAAPEDPEGDPT